MDSFSLVGVLYACMQPLVNRFCKGCTCEEKQGMTGNVVTRFLILGLAALWITGVAMQQREDDEAERAISKQDQALVQDFLDNCGEITQIIRRTPASINCSRIGTTVTRLITRY
jgi:hypothetical protein